MQFSREHVACACEQGMLLAWGDFSWLFYMIFDVFGKEALGDLGRGACVPYERTHDPGVPGIHAKCRTLLWKFRYFDSYFLPKILAVPQLRRANMSKLCLIFVPGSASRRGALRFVKFQRIILHLAWLVRIGW